MTSRKLPSLLEASERQDPEELWACVELLQDFQRFGEIAHAYRLASRCVELHPTCAPLRALQGLAALERRLYDEGISSIRRAMELEGERPPWMLEALLEAGLRAGDGSAVAEALRYRVGFRDSLEGLRAFRLDWAIQLVEDRVLSKEITELLMTGSYEGDERRACYRYLRPTDRVLEVGAGIGAVSCCIADIVGDDAVVCVEPNERLARSFQSTAGANGLSLELRTGAVVADDVLSGGQARATFSSPGEFWGAAVRAPEDGEVSWDVPLLGMNQLLRDSGATALVMDAEGAEYELLQNCNLGSLRCVVFEVHEHAESPEALGELYCKLVADGFHVRLCEAPVLVVAERAPAR